MGSEMKKVELEDGQSADIISVNIEQLKELFPEAFTEHGEILILCGSCSATPMYWIRAKRKMVLTGTGKRRHVR